MKLKKTLMSVAFSTIMMSMCFSPISANAEGAKTSEEIIKERHIRVQLTQQERLETMHKLVVLKRVFFPSEIETPIKTVTLLPVPSVEEVVEKYQDTISEDMDVTKLSGFSLLEFKVLMDSITQDDQDDEKGFYSENAETIYELAQEFQINEIVFCGIISLESGYGVAENCVAKNNYTGMMSRSGGLAYYDSVYENLRDSASNLHNNYLSPDGSLYRGETLSDIGVNYCDSRWAGSVWGRMLEIMQAD